MNVDSLLHRALAIAAALAAASVESAAWAFPDCTTLPGPIYTIGGSSPTPIFQKLGTALSAQSSPQTFIYQTTGGSCSGVNAVINNAAITGNATYWDATGAAQTCTFTVSQPADFGIASTYATSCPGVTSVPSGVGDFIGPIQSFDFIVPPASSADAISAEAGYFLFGFGASTTYPVGNWTVPKSIITRNNQSGAAIIIALALNVPLADLANTTVFTDGASNSGTLSLVESPTGTADATLGIVSSEQAEGAGAGKVKVLPYQHYGQQCGWLPSSSATVFDKINVRNGHYAIWANIHFFAAVDSTGTPTNANAKSVIGWFTETVTPPTGVDVDGSVVKAGAVLDCAMEVKRSSDLGALEPYAPAAPCGCYFDSVATGTTSCSACTTDATCPASATHCRKGFCEVN